MTSPYGNNLHHSENVTHGQFAFTTSEAGNYMACFWLDDHQQQAGTTTLSLDWKIGIAAKDWDSVAKKEKIEASPLKCFTLPYSSLFLGSPLASNLRYNLIFQQIVFFTLNLIIEMPYNLV